MDETDPCANRRSLVQCDAHIANVALTRPVRVPDVRATSSRGLGTTSSGRNAHATRRVSSGSTPVNTMQIAKNTSVAMIVKRTWANLHGVRMFLRHHDNPTTEIRGVDESHIIFATVLDSEDASGVWIALPADKQKPESPMFSLLVPWSQVLTIVVGEQFSPAIRREARKIGFTGETEPE
jgi:hypothetical protein